MTLEELRQKRLKWVEANRENGFDDGIRRLLTELYPDNAHFIYELLQNAEDARATKVCFFLKEDCVEFEHNGDRLFSIEDVDSITSIGASAKRDDATNIGKFGIGFKAVYAYTSTPEIASGRYHFRIRDLVVPDTEDLTPITVGDKETRFYFPFDNPAKPPKSARGEIEENLRQLDESTLLFLSNIRKIEYLLPDSTLGFLERKETAQNRIEILVQHPEETEPDSAVFLRFEKTVDASDENGESQPVRIAIAFGLERNQDQETKQSGRRRGPTRSVQWKIKSLEPGKVCIYFPAEKETSNLRFHLHAPFASTVARDGVRDCPANDALRDHLADLIAESMKTICDQGMLTVAFLATLPNERDSLSAFYEPVMEKLIEIFNSENLTPMKEGGHAAARGSFRGQARLSELISDRDLATILGIDLCPPKWISNPPQRNQREDNFLSMLDIDEWTAEDLVSHLCANSEAIERWLSGKPDAWHQKFYALLGDFLADAPSHLSRDSSNSKGELSELHVIRCIDGVYRIGGESYFSTNGAEYDENFPRVAVGVYSSGNNVLEQGKSRRFLEEIGVREVGEVERVESILKQRYSKGQIRPREQDMERFVALVEEDPVQANLFGEYYIFQLDNGKWGKPRIVFLDAPYLETGLSAYYEALEEGTRGKRALSPNYEEFDFKSVRLGKFAEAVGAQTKLQARQQEIIPGEHPRWSRLRDPGGWSDRYGINEDYDIPEFDLLLNAPNIGRSKLIWDTMKNLPAECLEAKYRSNSWYGEKTALSTIVHRLIRASWVPQKQDNQDIVSFLMPSESVADRLPKGFSFEPEAKWLQVIAFGKDRRDREEAEHQKKQRATQEYQLRSDAAEKLDFSSPEEAREAKEALELKRKDPEGFQKWQNSNRQNAFFPSEPIANPDRRTERLAEQYDDSPEKEYETRERSVRVTSSEINPHTYLKNQYTNEHGQMKCQVCEWNMPFRKRDGEYYFEAVEALSKDYFYKEMAPQFLALCPLCAAKYKEFVKRDEEAMKSLYDALRASDKPQVQVTLEDSNTESLRFVEAHWVDMQTILKKSSLSEAVRAERRDAWTEHDKEDISKASLRYADGRYPE